MENAEITAGQLVLVATPLGNLGDISRRALELLANADVIYCEDTRRSSTLFSAHSIAVNGRLRALHEHNEASLCEQVVDQVAGRPDRRRDQRRRDPGHQRPRRARRRGGGGGRSGVTTAPGPSAVVAALTISGLATERFAMEGFLPRKAGEREALYAQWVHEPRTIVFYESPQRLAATLTEMAAPFGVATRLLSRARSPSSTKRSCAARSPRSRAVVSGREVLGEIVVVLGGQHRGRGHRRRVDPRGAARPDRRRGEHARRGLLRRRVTRRRAPRVYQMALALRADDAP